MPSCFVPGCSSGYHSCKERRGMFATPKDPELFQLWARRIPRDGLTRKSRVCGLHFQEDEIIKDFCTIINGQEVRIPRDSWRLKAGAVPSKFPGCPAYLSKNTVKRKEPVKREDPPPKKTRRKSQPAETRDLENAENIEEDSLDHESSLQVNDMNPVVFSIRDAALPGPGWNWITIKNSNRIRCDECVATAHPLGVFRKTALITPDLSEIQYYVFSVRYKGKLLQDSCQSISELEQQLKLFDTLRICPGCDKSDFQTISTCNAGQKIYSVWHSVDCEMLLRPNDQQVNKPCDACVGLEKILAQNIAKMKNMSSKKEKSKL